MSAEARMLFDMPMREAKALRMRFGDAKYGEGMIRDTSMLLEAYIEAVDMNNYYDLALERGELTDEQHGDLVRLLTIGVLSPLRRIIPREAK